MRFLHSVYHFSGGRNIGHDFSLFHGQNLDELLLLRTRWVPTEKGTYFVVNILGLRLKLWKRKIG